MEATDQIHPLPDVRRPDGSIEGPPSPANHLFDMSLWEAADSPAKKKTARYHRAKVGGMPGGKRLEYFRLVE